MINLEHPITKHGEPEEKEFTFKMHPHYIRLLQKGNINLVNAANNHIYDYGITGIETTMEYLDSVNIAYVGIGKSLQEAREPVIFTIKDRRLGFLGYFGGAGQFAGTDTSAGLAPRYTSFILQDIRKLRPLVDYVIVSFHWGIENERYPEEWQMILGRAAVDAGADLVVGHHPHVLQGIERYNGGVIAYSIGNFIFGGNRRRVHDTIVLQAVFGDRMSVRPVPVRIDNWRVMELEKESARAVIDTLRVYSHDFDDCIFREYRLHGEK
jgi:poly-gamma-glutamate capsule biosynthesis protein CapA/YwtB (metallophosphatase superfamily)